MPAPATACGRHRQRLGWGRANVGARVAQGLAPLCATGSEYNNDNMSNLYVAGSEYIDHISLQSTQSKSSLFRWLIFFATMTSDL
jgi:hypothetical protein